MEGRNLRNAFAGWPSLIKGQYGRNVALTRLDKQNERRGGGLACVQPFKGDMLCNSHYWHPFDLPFGSLLPL